MSTMLKVSGREIDGELACEPVSTQRDEDGNERDRWVVFELYHLTGEAGWLVHRTGMSRVYHRRDTLCRTKTMRMAGTPAGVDDLPDDAVPCPKCQPRYPENLPDGPGTIRFETPRHTWDGCPTAYKVREKLTTIRSRDGTVSEVTSDPVDKLLRAAAQYYPEFAELLAA